VILKKLLLALFLFASLAGAQGTDALLTGNVVDGTGALVADAKIIALGIDTGVTKTVMSNSAGAYTFVSLLPGNYKITAEKAGFRKLVLENLVLGVGDKVEENLRLEVGSVSEAVQVSANPDGVQYLTPTLGGMINEQRLDSLPVSDRNAIQFALTEGGLISTGNGVNVNGGRTDLLNVTLDGMNIMDQAVNESIENQNIITSIDRIQEIRVVTSPADAEYSGGSGQIQLISRSGTNQFHGAAYDYLHNTDLNANSWANNRAGTARNILNENNPGVRLDGPVKKNKTFFFGLFEMNLQAFRTPTTDTVYTQQARQGIFRFYPGVQGANYTSNNPTADASGNPVTPKGATGALQSVSVFGLDANRTAPDASGIIAKNLALMPLPNIYNTGDGLNTAGYLWFRPSQNNTYSNTGRLDQYFSDKQRFSISYSRDYENYPNGNDSQNYPTSAEGAFKDWADVGSAALVSTISPTMINEARIGVNRATFLFAAPWTNSSQGTNILPSINGTPYLLGLSTVTGPYSTGTGEDPQGRISPIYTFSNKFTWLKGRHSMKAGFEVDFGSENAFVSFDVVPRVSVGTGNAAISNAFNTEFGNNATSATSLLNNLAGSVGTETQQYYSPGGANPQFIAGSNFQHTWRHRDFGTYFQDDIKLTKDLTINAGLRWDYFGTPYEADGRLETAVGGASAAFGVSGNNFNALFHPGTENLNNLTQLQLIGRNSPNPGILPWDRNFKNFAPALGLSWALPWLGQNKTVFRAGYGIAYEKSETVILDDLYGFGIAGLGQTQTVTPNVYTNLSASSLFPPTPAQSGIVPLTAPAINDAVTGGQTFLVANNGLKQPYIQNYNASLGRQITPSLRIDIRYVGSKGTRLWEGTNINELNTVENGILQAFETTLAGGNSPLLNQIFNGLNVPNVGVVNGTTITGSQAMRTNSTLYSYLIYNSPGQLASTIASSTFITGIRGGLIKNGGLPANFVVANPQFGAVDYISNFGSSTYNSGQVEVNKHLSNGLEFQVTYVRSKTLGSYDGNQQSQVTSFLTLRNEALSKQLLSFDRPNVWTTNMIYNLPFGPNKKLLGGARGLLARVVENWQTSVIFTKSSGSPTNFSTSITNVTGVDDTFNGNTGTVAINGPVPTGSVHIVGNNVEYFPASYTQVADPSIKNLPSSLQSLSPLLALQGPNGVAVQNPLVGTVGGTDPVMFHGLGPFSFNVDLSKTIQLTERFRLSIRADALNVLNHPIWSTPNLDINSTSLGLITSATGNRNVVLGARVDF
jgi:hypothetical protein